MFNIEEKNTHIMKKCIFSEKSLINIDFYLISNTYMLYDRSEQQITQEKSYFPKIGLLRKYYRYICKI